MAKDTQNQKVFVPLEGVLRVQDYIRETERTIDSHQSMPDSLRLTHARHVAAKYVIEMLGLPIAVRNYQGE